MRGLLFSKMNFVWSEVLKLSKYVTLSSLTYNASQWVPVNLYSSRFITYAPSFILVNYVLNKLL